MISVFTLSTNAGVPITKDDAQSAVLNVNQLLLKAKKDELGEFTEQSNTVQPRRRKWCSKPNYWGDIVTASVMPGRESCLVVSLEYSDSIDYHDCDLLINSHDVNSCSFVKKLCKCLLLKKSTIYFEVSEISSRGQERLFSLVRDMKKFLDERVLVILAFKDNRSNNHLVKLAELNLRSFNKKKEVSSSESKRIKLGEHIMKPQNHSINADASCQEEDNRASDYAESKQNDSSILKMQADFSRLEAELDASRATSAQMQTFMNTMAKRIDDLEESNDTLKSQLEMEKNKNDRLNEIINREKTCKMMQNNPLTDTCTIRVTAENTPNKNAKEECNQNSGSVSPQEVPSIEKNTGIDIKDAIAAEERRVKDAGPIQILNKVFRIFKYYLLFSEKKYHKDDFYCTVCVTDIDKGFENYKCTWKGQGRSKKLAKRAAFLSMLNVVKSTN